MDNVGAVLAQLRSREVFPWRAGLSFAAALHLSLAAILIAASLSKPRTPLVARAVSVRLMPAGQIAGQRAPRPVAPPVETRKILKPVDPEPPPSEKALVLPDKDRRKPAPRPTVAAPSHASPAVDLPAGPAGGEESAAGTGTTSGVGGLGLGTAGVEQGDFQYSYYIERMLVAISLQWVRPGQPPAAPPVIRFVVQRDGTVTDATIFQSSGVPFADRAALRAVLSAAPLPPLPAEFAGREVGFRVIFGGQ
jgi:TonB family protein